MNYKFTGLYIENGETGNTDEFIQVITRYNGKRCVILSNGKDEKVIPYDSLYEFCNRFPTKTEAKQMVKMFEEYLKKP